MQRKSHRLLALLLAILAVLPLLIACKKGDEPPTEYNVITEGKSEYVIVYADGNDEEQAVAVALSKALKDATGATLSITNDFHLESEPLPETAKEILVGATNRTESQNAIAGLKQKDFTVTVANARVVIAGGAAEATARAVEYFVTNHVDAAAKSSVVPADLAHVDRYQYLLGDLSISGVSLKEYKIVYPKSADLVTKYIAVNIADYLLNNAGIELEVVTDSAKETECELLVGATNRAASEKLETVPLANDEYMLVADGKKIVMWGKSYMAGAAASELLNTHFASKGTNKAVDATDIPTTAKAAKFSFKKATSAILMIGDGMGFNHISMTLEDNKLQEFFAYRLPNVSSCTTYSHSVTLGKAAYTDSAASATALATGYKSLNGYLGLDYNGTSRQNVRELAHEAGAKTAVVTTDVITGATPSGFLCHHNSRKDTTVLQGQINKLIKDKKVDVAVGSVGDNLTKETREALATVSEGNGKFFAMIEGAYIDKRSHDNNTKGVYNTVIRFNDCIAYVIGFVMLHPTTALIITADHECGGLTKNPDTGVYEFTSDNHTNVAVPYFAMGDGTDAFVSSKPQLDNVETAKFIAKIFGNSSFGG